ncbi:MAG: DUF4296 domain-containing protein [Bacteroidota bacterium]
MYLRVVFIVLCIALFASCRPKTDEDEQPPSHVLSEQLFLKVLTDCYLGEGAAGINVKSVTGEKFDSAYIFNPFADNNVTKQQFDTTIVYYSKHPQKLKAVYNKLLDNLSQILAVGTLSKVHIDEKNKYKGQDARFYFNTSKTDSIESSTKQVGYNLKFPYRLY